HCYHRIEYALTFKLKLLLFMKNFNFHSRVSKEFSMDSKQDIVRNVLRRLATTMSGWFIDRPRISRPSALFTPQLFNSIVHTSKICHLTIAY
ncbi:hypothetical protein L9F63_003786, partial [Diploptera punctata]